jgi:DMSO/TMAO reductase YedYZ molybdopterin-dependent catalytic subunit
MHFGRVDLAEQESTFGPQSQQVVRGQGTNHRSLLVGHAQVANLQPVHSPDSDMSEGVGGHAGELPFRTFLESIGADLTAKYAGFECADGYYSSIDMASALHPQTLLTFKISDEILAPRYGYPLKLRIATKLGFKYPTLITAMYVTNRFPGGFWEDRGYNWFGGV